MRIGGLQEGGSGVEGWLERHHVFNTTLALAGVPKQVGVAGVAQKTGVGSKQVVDKLGGIQVVQIHHAAFLKQQRSTLNQKVGWRVSKVVVGDDGVVVTIEQLVEWWRWRLLPSVGGVLVEMGGPIEQEGGRVFIGIGDAGVGCLEARHRQQERTKDGVRQGGHTTNVGEL